MSTAIEPVQPTRGWRSAPERGTVLGIRFVAFLCNTFGRRAASGFLFILSVYYALFHPAARRASRDYLRRIGEPTTMGAVIAHFWNFARVSLDRYLFLTGRIDEFEMHQEGHDRILGAAAGALEGADAPSDATGGAPADAPAFGTPSKKKGAVLIGSHLGSFEAMRAIAKKTEVPITVVVDFRTAQRVNGVLARLSPNLNFRMIGLDPTRATSMLDVKACIDRGELVAILADRVPDRSDRSTTAEFLGATAKFPTGPFLVAHMLNCPVFLVFGLFRAPNRYEIHCEPFADVIKLPRATRAEALKTYVEKYAARLEVYARKAPYNWFNFFDFWSAD